METTMTKQERIDAINANYQAVLDEIKKRQDYRWENYYDCVDDYCVCGLQDKAEAEWASRELRKRDIFLEEVEKGFSEGISTHYVLKDLDTGEVVADKVINGKYGQCFKVGDSWVGVPRTTETLHKKGYELWKITNFYKCYDWKRFSNNGNSVFGKVELDHTEETLVSGYIDYLYNDSYLDWFAKNC